MIGCCTNIDAKNAFLNGDLEEEVYMTIHPRLENRSNQKIVYKLKKSLYGLKQSPRAWLDRFAKTVTTNGHRQCQADHTLFVKSVSEGKMVIFIVYVDDIISTRDDLEEILNLKKLLATKFEINDLRTLKVFPRDGGGPVKGRNCYISNKVHVGFVK